MCDHVHHPITSARVEIAGQNHRRQLLSEDVDDLSRLAEALLFGAVEVHTRHDHLASGTGQPDAGRQHTPRFLSGGQSVVHDLGDGPSRQDRGR